MRGTVIVAESASVHPDGTFSMLRGHITQVSGPQFPLGLPGALVILIEAEAAEDGPHNFEIRGMDEDGKEGGPRLSAQFNVPKGGGNVALTFGFDLQFKKPGRHEFVLKIDNQVKHAAVITAVNTSAPS